MGHVLGHPSQPMSLLQEAEMAQGSCQASLAPRPPSPGPRCGPSSSRTLPSTHMFRKAVAPLLSAPGPLITPWGVSAQLAYWKQPHPSWECTDDWGQWGEAEDNLGGYSDDGLRQLTEGEGDGFRILGHNQIQPG